MPVVWKDFDSYQLSYVSDSGVSSYVNACEINCFKSGAFVARICFYKEGKVLPANTLNSGAPYIFFPLSQFGDILDILRSEARPLCRFREPRQTLTPGRNRSEREEGAETREQRPRISSRLPAHAAATCTSTTHGSARRHRRFPHDAPVAAYRIDTDGLGLSVPDRQPNGYMFTTPEDALRQMGAAARGVATVRWRCGCEIGI
jgi:hypothetical protein